MQGDALSSADVDNDMEMLTLTASRRRRGVVRWCIAAMLIAQSYDM